MKTKIILCFALCVLCAVAIIVQNRSTTTCDDIKRGVGGENRIVPGKRAKIKDYLNREILIENDFAGQSITLIRENEDYFVLRKYFGSGVPVIGTAKYKVVFQSDW